MERRREDQIRKLCSELLAQPDTNNIQETSRELRSQLRTYVEELRKQFAVYPGVQAYRRRTDAAPNAPPVPHIPEAAAPSPIIHPKAEATIEASSNDGPSEIKAS